MKVISSETLDFFSKGSTSLHSEPRASERLGMILIISVTDKLGAPMEVLIGLRRGQFSLPSDARRLYFASCHNPMHIDTLPR